MTAVALRMTVVALRAPSGTFSANGEAWKRFLVRARKASGPNRCFISVKSGYVAALEKSRNWEEFEALKAKLKEELDKLDPVLYLSMYDGVISIGHGNVCGE
ncbi:MAG: hypothetical protein Q7R67_00350 [bacterium]|nr:hypothetical protein [bacterium]